MAHTHKASPDTLGHIYEVCECGAVRVLNRKTNKYDQWHACELCSTEYHGQEGYRLFEEK